jgi:hypothetical protein
MLTSNYALAVKISDLEFEVFEILNLDIDEERDSRYKAGILKGSKVINPKNKSGIKIGSFWTGSEFIPDNYDDCLEIDDDINIYTLLSDDKVFGFIMNKKNTFLDEKFQAAFDLDVILIDLSEHSGVSFGDIWDGKKFTNSTMR